MAQDLKSDLKRMYEAYANMKNFSMDINVKIYKYREDKTPNMMIKGFLKRNGDQYLASIDRNVVMVNEDNTVYVDGIKKMIIYRDNKEKRGEKLPAISYGPDDIGRIVDSMVRKSDTIRYVGVTGRDRQYIIGSSRHVIQSADILIDTVTGVISQITYYYNSSKMKTNNKVVVEFRNINSDLPETKSDYALSQFISDEKGKVASSKYKGYRVFKDTKKGLN